MDQKPLKGIPVHSNDILFVDWCGRTVTVYLVDTTCLLNYAGVFKIRLRSIKIVYMTTMASYLVRHRDSGCDGCRHFVSLGRSRREDDEHQRHGGYRRKTQFLFISILLFFPVLKLTVVDRGEAFGPHLKSSAL